MALVCEVSKPEESDIIVYTAPHRGAVDLCVCRVDVRGVAMGHEGLWHFVDAYSPGVTRIYFASSRAQAELLICYVPHRGAAGWRRDHMLQGTL